MDMIDSPEGVPHQPARFLVEHVGLLPPGRALDVAMGSGRNAIYLARMGFEVDGVDISPEAVEEARTRAREEGVALQASVVDLEEMPEIELEAYDLVICFNYLQRSLMPLMKRWLRPGGMLVYETFIIDQVQFGRPRNPDYLLGHNELLHAFLDLRVLCYREGIIEDRKAIASLLAQKV